MLSEFTFFAPTRVYAGIGRSKQMGEILSQNSINRIVIWADEAVVSSEYFKEVFGAVSQGSEILDIVKVSASREPDYDYLTVLCEKARAFSSADAFIGIGGGTCMDLTKAVAVMANNPGDPIAYRGFDLLQSPGVPTLLIPTTAGTGSEATANASFIDLKQKRKLGINGKHMNATYCILDARWLDTCPIRVAVSSGMDALVHAVESFFCMRASPITQSFSREAFRLLWKNLPALIDDPANLERKQQLLYGSFFAGIGISNASASLASALSYPIGVHYGVPHGIGSGIFLASTLEWYISQGVYDFGELYDIVESVPGLSLEQKAVKLVRAIRLLKAQLGVPKNLEQWGITNVQRATVYDLMGELRPAFAQSKVPFSYEADLPKLLDAHIC